MSINLNFLFYLKKPKLYLSGPVPVYLRITVAGKRSELTTGRVCEPNRWNTSAGRASGNKESVKSLNAYLEALQVKLFEAHRQLAESGTQITAEALKGKITGKGEKARMLMEIFRDHNSKLAALVGVEFSPNTLERYETSLNHTRAFLEWKFQVSDIDIRRIDYAFITEYEFYLRSVRGCINNTAVKYIKNFGKIIRICLDNGWLTRSPLQNYKSKIRKVDRVFLSEDELELIANKVFASDRLSQVRDIFLFCCFTGLSYVDVKQLRKTDIAKGIDGEQWIFIKRQKTDISSRIPLLPAAHKILMKHKEHSQCLADGRVLPVLSNQKMNAYLKEIADVCGIQKQLTFHIARHTFATTITLLNGVPMESVSKMLGHTNLRTTQHYAKILDVKVSEDMKVLKGKFK